MPRGGPRPNSGPPKGTKYRKRGDTPITVATVERALEPGWVDPLKYMLSVINDPAADVLRRDRMAQAAAPFCHPRIADDRFGKKDASAAAAKDAASGKYASPTAPKLVVNNSGK